MFGGVIEALGKKRHPAHFNTQPSSRVYT
jgi:hypothetical protein